MKQTLKDLAIILLASVGMVAVWLSVIVLMCAADAEGIQL